jgi:two-component system OmpR family response regulator
MRILLVEDDVQASKYIQSGLSTLGHVVDSIANGKDALSYAIGEDYDVAIIDRLVPGLDGLSLVRGFRAAGCRVPVLFLTSLTSVEDRVTGLEAGADDYMMKPFAFSELIARVNALGRRPPLVNERTCMQLADLEVNLLRRTVRRGATGIELLPKEYAILNVLLANEGRIITKNMLLEKVWSIDFDPQTTVVETHMSRLRSKIDKPFEVQLIHTTRNIGYSMHAPR